MKGSLVVELATLAGRLGRDGAQLFVHPKHVIGPLTGRRRRTRLYLRGGFTMLPGHSL